MIASPTRGARTEVPGPVSDAGPSHRLTTWALGGFLVGAWAAATVAVAFPLAFTCAALGGLWACLARTRPLVLAAWVVLGFGLAGANHARVESATVHEPGRFDAVGVVGSDWDAGRQILRIKGGRVRLGGLEAPLPLGATVRVSGELRPLRGDTAMIRRSHYARLSGEVVVKSVATERGPPLPLLVANAARTRLQVAAGHGLGGDRSGLLLGLLIGDDSSLSESVVEEFRRGGLSHLLVVSGSNLGFVMGAIAFLTLRLPLGWRARIAVAALAMVLYVLVTRAEPSVLRAAAMTTTGLAIAWMGAPRDRLGSCAVAVLGLVVLDPFLAASIGFQLSAAATVGILLWTEPLTRRLRVWLPARVAAAVALTMAAQVAVTPLLVWHFERASAVGVFTNLVAVPLAGLITVAAAALALPATVWAVAFAPLGPLLGLLLRIGHVAAGLPGADLMMSRWTLAVAAVAAVVVVAAAKWHRTRVPVRADRRGGHRRRVLFAVAAVFAAGVIAVPVVSRLATVPLCDGATFLDVGQGDATLLRAPDGTTVLVDAGRNAARLDTLLRKYGVQTIDLLVVTHGDSDHVGGAAAVTGRRRLRAVIAPEGITWPSDTSRGAQERIASSGVEVRSVRNGDTVSVGEVRIEVLHPLPRTVASRANDVSIVAVAEVAGLRILLTADADAEVQRRVLGRVGDVDVAKVPHHGSRDQEPDLPAEARPEVSVVPVGPNTYGHPTDEALDLWGGPGVRRYRNDVDGTVEVCATGRPREAVVNLRR